MAQLFQRGLLSVSQIVIVSTMAATQQSRQQTERAQHLEPPGELLAAAEPELGQG